MCQRCKHKANHPVTKHYCESVWDVDPIKVCKAHQGDAIQRFWTSIILISLLIRDISPKISCMSGRHGLFSAAWITWKLLTIQRTQACLENPQSPMRTRTLSLRALHIPRGPPTSEEDHLAAIHPHAQDSSKDLAESYRGKDTVPSGHNG